MRAKVSFKQVRWTPLAQHQLHYASFLTIFSAGLGLTECTTFGASVIISLPSHHSRTSFACKKSTVTRPKNEIQAHVRFMRMINWLWLLLHSTGNSPTLLSLSRNTQCDASPIACFMIIVGRISTNALANALVGMLLTPTTRCIDGKTCS